MRITRIFIIFCFISVLPSSIALAEDCGKAVELYNQGTLSKDFKEKETLFKKAIPLCTDSEILSRVHNNLADCYEARGRLSKALIQYRKAIGIKKDLVTSYTSVGNIFFKLGDYYSAFLMYGKALKIKPDDPDALQGQEKAGEGFKMKMTLYFDLNSSKIAEEYQYRLRLVGESMRNDPKIKTIQITGHTCDLGSKTENQTLSRKRAEAVAGYLKENYSLNDHTVRILGRGNDYPLLHNKDNEARTLNRRTEIILK